jgi:peptidoglycan hydrolase CwlO-like protein
LAAIELRGTFQPAKGDFMSEDITKKQDADSTSTNPLPFEEFVKQHLTLLLNQQKISDAKQDAMQEQINGLQQQINGLQQQVNGLQQQVNGLQERVNSLQMQINGLQQQINDMQLQISRQIKNLDQKVDVFIREHGYIKDDIREIRALQGMQN